MGVVSALDDHENKMSDYSDEFVDLDRKMEWIKQRIQNKQVTYIILYHDESTIHKMEHSLYGWCHKEVSRFLPKSVGKGYNISDFITAYDGFLKVNDDDTARVIHKVGGDTDTYVPNDILAALLQSISNDRSQKMCLHLMNHTVFCCSTSSFLNV
eukprot:790753_1